MNMLLTVIGAFIGLFVTGAALYTAWTVHHLWRQQAASPRAVSQVEIAVTYFSKWTILDFSAIGLFLIGFVLLLAELVSVHRGQTEATLHFMYLLSGMIYCSLGMLLLIVRLTVVLAFLPTSTLQRAAAVAPDHQHEPHNAN
ncbi:hypothetical protein [Paenibacillus whitsoniae]|uniref:Transmembrane protein n=1 Tax=Paenibacillus whitsoniae TaxID=2496558 RepID=A0A3S0C616_9BACL|nr:hypothetical protein [Paenibacillus whitsoniae]RTE01995.1 hypothetical protein EJQ19_30375 [Paenibacillus whitsoniae]